MIYDSVRSLYLKYLMLTYYVFIMKCLEIRQSYRYSYGLCFIIYLVKHLSSYVRLIMLGQVWLVMVSSVRFGYISLYFITQKLGMCRIYK